ncbi:MAG: hypothetical protein B7Z37_23260 [Verrucomicrobia bacterium 12-59-8]|nr:MAG: hypothetical protein B7Z37_23260 [Verrucomicrobia bacterium 12-59-8]
MSEDAPQVEAPAVAAPAPTKNALLSKGVIGGALAAVSGLAVIFGIGFTADDAKNVGDMIDVIIEKSLGISAAVGGILAVIGRIKAETKIKFPWQKD